MFISEKILKCLKKNYIQKDSQRREIIMKYRVCTHRDLSDLLILITVICKSEQVLRSRQKYHRTMPKSEISCYELIIHARLSLVKHA